MLPLPDTAPYLVSPYAGIHPPRSPRRKKTIGQIRRETACSPNRSKIERERGGEERKKKKRKGRNTAFLSIGFLVIPSLRRQRAEEKAIEIEGEKEREKDVWTMHVHVHREIAEKERERVLLRSLHREMVNGDNEARDKSGEGAS